MIPKVYAVDFDGYLCTNAWPDIGEPHIAFIQHFRELREQGHKLILWTCREGEALQRAIDWCAKHGLAFDAYNENLPERIAQYGGDCRKISADWYCDDKNYWLMPEEDRMKPILDVTCGNRSIWFDKHNPLALYCDKRTEHHESDYGSNISHRTLNICPDIECDFTDLPFPDNTYSLVVFDPPHLKNMSKDAWLTKAYGSLDDNWQALLRDGFSECMRVLKPNGVLILKWADTHISTRDLIKAIGTEPLFGHRSGKKMNTHWMAFMKIPNNN